jgi:hypothetical protein
MFPLDTGALAKIGDMLGIKLPLGTWIAADTAGQLQEIIFPDGPYHEYEDDAGSTRSGVQRFILNPDTGQMESHVSGTKKGGCLALGSIVAWALPQEKGLEGVPLLQSDNQVIIIDGDANEISFDRRYSCHKHFGIDEKHDGCALLDEQSGITLDYSLPDATEAAALKRRLRSIISLEKSRIGRCAYRGTACDGVCYDLEDVRRYFSEKEEFISQCVPLLQSGDLELSALGAQALLTAVMRVPECGHPELECAKIHNEFFQKNEQAICSAVAIATAAQECGTDYVILKWSREKLDALWGRPPQMWSCVAKTWSKRFSSTYFKKFPPYSGLDCSQSNNPS